MGKSERSTAAIGIKILLEDLIAQINETNIKLVLEMLDNGIIEDENDFFNEVYKETLYGLYDELDIDHPVASVWKEHLTKEMKSHGSYHKTRSGKVIPTLDNGCLYERYVLVPVKPILETERWGYEREGTNGLSRPLDFDLSVDLEKYNEIVDKAVVFLVSTSSG